jgi:hypothetical protein
LIATLDRRVNGNGNDVENEKISKLRVWITITRSVIFALLALVLAIAIVLIIAQQTKNGDILNAIRAQQVTTHRSQQETQQALRILIDCTTPGHACNLRSQKATTDAIKTLEQIIIYANGCQDRPGVQSLSEIEACVTKLLK